MQKGTTARTSGFSKKVDYGTRVTGLGESCRVCLDIDGILGERFQVIQHNAHVRVVTNVHRYIDRLPTVPHTHNNSTYTLYIHLTGSGIGTPVKSNALLSAVWWWMRKEWREATGRIWSLCFLQCSDTVDWVTESGSKKPDTTYMITSSLLEQAEKENNKVMCNQGSPGKMVIKK